MVKISMPLKNNVLRGSARGKNKRHHKETTANSSITTITRTTADKCNNSTDTAAGNKSAAANLSCTMSTNSLSLSPISSCSSLSSKSNNSSSRQPNSSASGEQQLPHQAVAMHAPPPPCQDDDEQTIHRLENECYKLLLALNKLRKCSQEWFFLDSKLTAAKEELEAAHQDRDLFLGNNTACEHSTSNFDARDELFGGKGIPETVLFVRKDDVGAASLSLAASSITQDETNKLLLSNVLSNVGMSSSFSGNESGNEKHQQQHNQHHHQQQQQHTVQDPNQQQYEHHRIAHEDSQGIAQKINSVPKFSPEWFQLKEDFIAMHTAKSLDGEETCANYSEDKNVVQLGDATEHDKIFDGAISGVAGVAVQFDQCEDTVSNLAGKMPGKEDGFDEFKNENIDAHETLCDRGNSPIDTTAEIVCPKNNAKSRDESGDKECFFSGKSDIEFPHENMSSEQVPSFAISPAPHPLENKSPTIHRRSMSPPLSPPSSPLVSRQLFPSFPPIGMAASSNVAGNYYYNHAEEGNNDDDRQEQQDRIERIAHLKTQHSEACASLEILPKFSKEWFDLKTNTVLLEEQLDELENASGGGGRSICGWSHFSSASEGGWGSSTSGGGCNRSSSCGWSESDDGIMSLGNEFGDVLERVMVVEALRQGNCASPIHYDDDDDDDISSSSSHSEDGKGTGKFLQLITGGYRVQISESLAATTIQRIWRMRSCTKQTHLVHSIYSLQIKSAVLIQSMWRRRGCRLEFISLRSASILIQSYIRLSLQTRRYRQLASSVVGGGVGGGGHKELSIHESPKTLSFLEKNTQYAANSTLSPTGEHIRLKIRMQRHQWLSSKLVHLPKYSPEWFETTAQLRELKEEISMLETISDSRHDVDYSQSGKENDLNSSTRDESEPDHDMSTNDVHGRVMIIVKTIEKSRSRRMEEDGSLEPTEFGTPQHHMSRQNESHSNIPHYQYVTPDVSDRIKNNREDNDLKRAGIECLRLSRKLGSLPKHCHQWVQSKTELDAATAELESLYAKSMKTEGQP